MFNLVSDLRGLYLAFHTSFKSTGPSSGDR